MKTRHPCIGRLLVASAAAVVLWSTGCARMEVYQRPDAKSSQLRRIAVLPFTPPPDLDKERAKGVCEGVCDMAATGLMQRGFDVVERARVEEIFKERNLNLSQMPSGKDLSEIGRVLGVDAFATGAITEWRDWVFAKHDGAVGITLKLYDAQTAQTIFSGSSSRPVGLLNEKTLTLQAQVIIKELCSKVGRR
jgi:curli biogenesis system outer membrane secretion channel CsgG